MIQTFRSGLNFREEVRVINRLTSRFPAKSAPSFCFLFQEIHPRDHTSADGGRACSSVGQSTRLISVGSEVQIFPGPPFLKRNEESIETSKFAPSRLGCEWR